jgi:hypothetical protein
VRVTIVVDYPGELAEKGAALLARVRGDIAADRGAEPGDACGTCYAHAGLAQRCLLHGDAPVTAEHVCDYYVHGPGFGWSTQAEGVTPLDPAVSGLRRPERELTKGRTAAARLAQADAGPADERPRKLRDRPLQQAKEAARRAVDETLEAVRREAEAILSDTAAGGG